jgi:hypothetical protein
MTVSILGFAAGEAAGDTKSLASSEGDTGAFRQGFRIGLTDA